MTDDKKDKAEKSEKTAEPEDASRKKSPLRLIIIIVVAGLLVGGGTAITFMIIKGAEKDTPAQEVGAKKSKTGRPAMLGPIIALDSFIVNLAGASGRNYLKVDISLELSDAVLQQEITNKLPKIRDMILLVLSTKTFDDVKTSQGKMLVKEDILMRINDTLTSGWVENLYFTSFVVQ